MPIKLGFTESPAAIRLNTNGRAVKTVPMFPAILPNIDRIYFEHTMRSVWALYHMLNKKWNHSEHIGVDYMAIKSVSVRIDERMLNKLHCIADYEGRSANSQILVLIRECIEQFEAKHGQLDGRYSAKARAEISRKQ